MESPRWWHVAVAATTAVLAALILLSHESPARTAWGFAALGVFVAAWLALGRDAEPSRPRSIAFQLALVAIAGIGTAATPSFATVQTIAYPLLWTRSRGLRQSLIANVALATAVGVGLFVSTGGDRDAAIQAIAIQATSLMLSLAMGFWITAISARSHERQRLLDELRAAQDSLAALSRDAGAATERERLAREIHDTIAQDLTGLVLVAQRARRELAQGDTAAADESLVLLEDGTRTTLAETRSLVAATAPVALAAGLAEALQRLADRVSRESGVRVDVSAAPVDGIGRDDEVVLLRCAQESLANVRKHAGAATASVTLAGAGGEARLTVRDDGHGFDVNAESSGFGLAGMHDRLALVGGRLEVVSSAAGTIVTVTVPLAGAPGAIAGAAPGGSVRQRGDSATAGGGAA